MDRLIVSSVLAVSLLFFTACTIYCDHIMDYYAKYMNNMSRGGFILSASTNTMNSRVYRITFRISMGIIAIFVLVFLIFNLFFASYQEHDVAQVTGKAALVARL